MPNPPSPPLAFVFDAYGTLFDVHSVAARAEALAPGHGAALSQLWRTKQLEYTWLGSLMERRLDFEAATRAALDYAIDALALPLTRADQAALFDEYLRLKPFPDVRTTLERMAPRPRLILSNGTLAMLEPVVRHAGLADVIDGVLSVDAAGIYKPSPRVYRLATDRLGLDPHEIAFVSSNGWDATGAKACGFTTFWINRTGAPIERHGPAPDHVVGTLAEIVALASV